MFFDKIVKIEKNYVERVENINIKVYTTNCVDNMQIDHLREWFLLLLSSKANWITWFLFNPLPDLKLGQRLVDHLQLHPGILVDVVVIGENFFHVGSEFLYLFLQFPHSVYRWIGYQLTDGDEGTND